MAHIETIPIENIRQDPGNLRLHNERNMAVITESIQEDGIVRPVALDADNTLIGGNATWEAAVAAGYTQVLVVETDGDVLVAHRRSNLDDRQRLRAGFRDNYATDLSGFDEGKVGWLVARDDDPLAGILSTAERDDYLLAAGAAAGKGLLGADVGPQDDRAVELAEQWGTEVGQVWEVLSLLVPGGRHIIAIGESHTPGYLARLFLKYNIARARCALMDPPYAVSYGHKNRRLNEHDRGNRIQTPIEGDDLTPEQVEELIRSVLNELSSVTEIGAGVYIAGPSGPLISNFLAAFNNSPFKFHQSLVWVKNNHVLGNTDYQNRHEMVFYGWKHDGPHYWSGNRSLESVIFVDKPQKSGLHPTTKPVALAEPFVANSTAPGEILVDPFAGSGWTLVAAEEGGRLSVSVEKTREYAAVILQRASDMGLVVRRVDNAEETT